MALRTLRGVLLNFIWNVREIIMVFEKQLLLLGLSSSVPLLYMFIDDY